MKWHWHQQVWREFLDRPSGSIKDEAGKGACQLKPSGKFELVDCLPQVALVESRSRCPLERGRVKQAVAA